MKLRIIGGDEAYGDGSAAPKGIANVFKLAGSSLKASDLALKKPAKALG